jgi:hypothetical protein
MIPETPRKTIKRFWLQTGNIRIQMDRVSLNKYHTVAEDADQRIIRDHVFPAHSNRHAVKKLHCWLNKFFPKDFNNES